MNYFTFSSVSRMRTRREILLRCTSILFSIIIFPDFESHFYPKFFLNRFFCFRFIRCADFFPFNSLSNDIKRRTNRLIGGQKFSGVRMCDNKAGTHEFNNSSFIYERLFAVVFRAIIFHYEKLFFSFDFFSLRLFFFFYLLFFSLQRFIFVGTAFAFDSFRIAFVVRWILSYGVNLLFLLAFIVLWLNLDWKGCMLLSFSSC